MFPSFNISKHVCHRQCSMLHYLDSCPSHVWPASGTRPCLPRAVHSGPHNLPRQAEILTSPRIMNAINTKEGLPTKNVTGMHNTKTIPHLCFLRFAGDTMCPFGLRGRNSVDCHVATCPLKQLRAELSKTPSLLVSGLAPCTIDTPAAEKKPRKRHRVSQVRMVFALATLDETTVTFQQVFYAFLSGLKSRSRNHADYR